jgi:hypothetical protein
MKNNKEYLEELDLMYRIVFERGLIPNPTNFNNPSLVKLAKKYVVLYRKMSNLDLELSLRKAKLEK